MLNNLKNVSAARVANGSSFTLSDHQVRQPCPLAKWVRRSCSIEVSRGMTGVDAVTASGGCQSVLLTFDCPYPPDFGCCGPRSVESIVEHLRLPVYQLCSTPRPGHRASESTATKFFEITPSQRNAETIESGTP
jgi:hypothetical protein